LIVNLFSYNTDVSTPDRFFSFNQVVAWSLHKAFTKIGVETRFIGNGQFLEENTPQADHSIVISSYTMKAVRDNPALHRKMREATTGRMTLYLDSDYVDWWKVFDYVFTVVKPVTTNPQYVYAGWGADPELFYPDQDSKAIFIDSILYGNHKGKLDSIYDDIKTVFHISDGQLENRKPLTHKTVVDGADIIVYMPIPIYRGNKVLWPEFGGIQRKCHFYLCTQLGESGLSRIESATCGALLVVPEALYRPRTMDSLECRLWRTRDDLLDILSMNVDVKANRERALKHSWDKVAGRMLKVFES